MPVFGVGRLNRWSQATKQWSRAKYVARPEIAGGPVSQRDEKVEVRGGSRKSLRGGAISKRGSPIDALPPSKMLKPDFENKLLGFRPLYFGGRPMFFFAKITINK